jgi:hypothetical protein
MCTKPLQELTCESANCFQDRLGNGSSARWVLPSDELAIITADHNLRTPIRLVLDKGSSTLLQHILKHEGHCAREVNGVFFRIGEAGDSLPFDEVVRPNLYVDQSRRAVADCRYNLGEVSGNQAVCGLCCLTLPAALNSWMSLMESASVARSNMAGEPGK